VLFILTREKAGSPPEEVARSTQKLALFTVNAGTYKLSVQASGSKVESSVNVLPGKISAVSMSLNLGNLDIKAVAAEGQQVPIPAWFQLYPAAGAKAAAFTISAASSQVQLPAGAYRVVAHYGQAMREDTVSIAPGETTTKTIVMDAGEAQLHIAAKAAAGIMPVCDVFSESAGGAPIARLAGTNASFIGRAGQYELRCHGKDAAQIIASKHIRIGAGETVMEEVTN
jgi:hypothetical protein